MTANDSQAGGKATPQAVSVSPNYEPCTPGLLPSDQVDTVREVHEVFLRGFTQAFSEYLEIPVTAALADVKQTPLSDFLNPGGGHACLITLDLHPMCGQAYLGLQPGFAFRTLNILLGTPQEGIGSLRSSVTEIELNIMRECFTLLVGELQRAWAVLKVKFETASIGGGKKPQASDARDTMLVLHTVVKLGEYEERFHLALPVLLVRLAATNFAGFPAGRPTSINPDRLMALRTAKCHAEAVLEGSTLTMGDLLAMEIGQILMLGQSNGSSFECTVNGKPTFRGELIHNGDRQALQIDSIL